MADTVDVRTKGWNNPDCCYRVEIDDSYKDDDGHWHHAVDWEDRLHCEITTINAKTDYCKYCNKNLVYP